MSEITQAQSIHLAFLSWRHPPKWNEALCRLSFDHQVSLLFKISPNTVLALQFWCQPKIEKHKLSSDFGDVSSCLFPPFAWLGTREVCFRSLTCLTAAFPCLFSQQARNLFLVCRRPLAPSLDFPIRTLTGKASWVTDCFVSGYSVAVSATCFRSRSRPSWSWWITASSPGTLSPWPSSKRWVVTETWRQRCRAPRWLGFKTNRILFCFADRRLRQQGGHGHGRAAALAGHPGVHGAQQPRPLPQGGAGDHHRAAHPAPAGVRARAHKRRKKVEREPLKSVQGVEMSPPNVKCVAYQIHRKNKMMKYFVYLFIYANASPWVISIYLLGRG